MVKYLKDNSQANSQNVQSSFLPCLIMRGILNEAVNLNESYPYRFM